MRKSIYSVLLLVLSFTSCQKENPEPALPDLGQLNHYGIA